MRSSPDARSVAFSALHPIAPTVKETIDAVNEAIRNERSLTSSAKSGWTPSQRAASVGFARFCWAIEKLRSGLRQQPRARRVSTEQQEASNVFLWLLDGRVTLRVKSDPQELREELTAQLFEDDPSQIDPSVCLTWKSAADLTIADASFVSLHGAAWTIPLVELLAAPAPSNVVTQPRRTPRVRSRRDSSVDTSKDASSPSRND